MTKTIFKDGIDYLIGFFKHWRAFLAIFLGSWAFLFLLLSLLPDEQRVVSVLQIGEIPSKNWTQTSQEKQLIEPLNVAAFRLENVALTQLLESQEFSSTGLAGTEIRFSTQGPDLIVMEARAEPSDSDDVLRLLHRLSETLISEHRTRYETAITTFENELSDTEGIIAEIQMRQTDADRLLTEEQQRSVTLDAQASEERYHAWSNLVYGVEASSSLMSQYRAMTQKRSDLKRALSSNSESIVALLPSVDPSKSYKPGVLLGIILTGMIAGVFAVLLVILKMVYLLARERQHRVAD